MSGEVSRRGPALQYGPRADADATHHPFSPRQLARIDEAMTLSSRESGLTFSVYVGSLEEPHRAAAESLFEILAERANDPVLVAVSPGQRVLHIVTGTESAARLPNRACALAALGMRASFSGGDLVGGIVTGLRMLADSAGQDASCQLGRLRCPPPGPRALARRPRVPH